MFASRSCRFPLVSLPARVASRSCRFPLVSLPLLFALLSSLMLGPFALPSASAQTASAVAWQAVGTHTPQPASSFTTPAPNLYDGNIGDTATGYGGSGGVSILWDLGSATTLRRYQTQFTGADSAQLAFTSSNGTFWRFWPAPVSGSPQTVKPVTVRYVQFILLGNSNVNVTDTRLYDLSGALILGPGQTPSALTASTVQWQNTGGCLPQPAASFSTPASSLYDGNAGDTATGYSGDNLYALWDLGSPVSLSRIQAQFVTNDEFYAFTSTDGVNWTDVDEFYGNGAASADVSVPVTARYVQFYMFGGGTLTDTRIYDASGALIAGPPAPPDPPANLSATAGNRQACWAWTPPPGTGLTYSIYLGTTPGGESATPLATGLTSPAYVATGLTNGMTYYVTVTATNSVGTSAPSDEGCCVVPLTHSPSAPDDFLAFGGGGQIILYWTIPLGATSYNLYRGRSSAEEDMTPLQTGITDNSFVDTTFPDADATPSTPYYYLLTAQNDKGESVFSAEACASPDGTFTAPDPTNPFGWNGVGAPGTVPASGTFNPNDWYVTDLAGNPLTYDNGLHNRVTDFYNLTGTMSGSAFSTYPKLDGVYQGGFDPFPVYQPQFYPPLAGTVFPCDIVAEMLDARGDAMSGAPDGYGGYYNYFMDGDTPVLLRGGVFEKVKGTIGTVWHWQGSGSPPDHIRVLLDTSLNASADQAFSDNSWPVSPDQAAALLSDLWGSASVSDSLGEFASVETNPSLSFLNWLGNGASYSQSAGGPHLVDVPVQYVAGDANGAWQAQVKVSGQASMGASNWSLSGDDNGLGDYITGSRFPMAESSGELMASAKPDDRAVTIIADVDGNPTFHKILTGGLDANGDGLWDKIVNVQASDGTMFGDIGIPYGEQHTEQVDGGVGQGTTSKLVVTPTSFKVTYRGHLIGPWATEDSYFLWYSSLKDYTYQDIFVHPFPTASTTPLTEDDLPVYANVYDGPIVDNDNSGVIIPKDTGKTDHIFFQFTNGDNRTLPTPAPTGNDGDGVTATANYYLTVHPQYDLFPSHKHGILQTGYNLPENTFLRDITLTSVEPKFAVYGDNSIECTWNAPGAFWGELAGAVGIAEATPLEKTPWLAPLLALAHIGLDKIAEQGDHQGVAFAKGPSDPNAAPLPWDDPASTIDPRGGPITPTTNKSLYHFYPTGAHILYTKVYSLIDTYDQTGFTGESQNIPLNICDGVYSFYGVFKYIPAGG